MKTTSIKSPTIEELEAKLTNIRVVKDSEVKRLEELSLKIDDLEPLKENKLKARIGLQALTLFKEKFAEETELLESVSVYTLADYAKKSSIIRSVCSAHNLYVH